MAKSTAELRAALRLYADERAHDDILPPTRIQSALYDELLSSGELEGITFAEYLGGVCYGPSSAQAYYAAVAQEQERLARLTN